MTYWKQEYKIARLVFPKITSKSKQKQISKVKAKDNLARRKPQAGRIYSGEINIDYKGDFPKEKRKGEKGT